MKIDKQKAIESLEKLWIGSKVCPVCLNSVWIINDELLEIRRWEGGGLTIGSPVYPYLSVTCNKCGYTHFLNAVILRLIDTCLNQESVQEVART